jgi:hypothetical protein
LPEAGFETDAGNGFRKPGFSKERRLEPQIALGLLTEASGFPLTVAAFEGNKAETATMPPVVNAFKTAHKLTDVTVVAEGCCPVRLLETAARVGGTVGGRRACGVDVGDFEYRRDRTEIARHVYVVRTGRIGDGISDVVHAVLIAVGFVVGQRASLDYSVDLALVGVPAGAAARRDGDVADDVVLAADGLL